jgi:DNA invertase Pin-like site-specific DNA recombinase
MKKAIGYIRVSTVEQGDKFGVEAQREAIKKFADENNYEISEWLVDKISGVKEERPAWNVILANNEVKNPPYEAVIVYKSDRVARDIKLYFYYLFLLEKKGVKLVSVNEDFQGELANVYRALILFCAEQERANITRRTSAGRTVKASKGGHAGGSLPLGYSSLGGALVVKPDEAETVRLIFKLFDGGMTYKHIADYLNEQGVPSKRGGLWEQGALFRLISKRKFYQGYYKYGKDKDWVKGQHEAILDEEEN